MCNQLTSESSPKALEQALQKGSRVIELDCWDDPLAGLGKCPVIVFHGHTATKPMQFDDAVVSMSKHAFGGTRYFPLCLTIENHCGNLGRGVLADELKRCVRVPCLAALRCAALRCVVLDWTALEAAWSKAHASV